MKQQTVIFDSNAYRGLNWDTLEEVKHREKLKGFRAKASPIVLLELVAHLLDADSNATICAKALAKLATHVKAEGDDKRLHVINGPETIITLALWNQRNIKEDQAAVALVQAVFSLGADGDGQLTSTDRTTVENVRKGMKGDEARWAELHSQIRHLDPTTMDFRSKWAQYMVSTYSERAGIRMTPDDIQSCEEYVLTLFEIPFQFTKHLYINHSAEELPGVRWSNHLWDLGLCFMFGPQHLLDGLPVLVVTTDGQFKEAARRVGHETQVLTLPEYLDLLAT